MMIVYVWEIEPTVWRGFLFKDPAFDLNMMV